MFKRCIVFLVVLIFSMTCQAGTLYLDDKSGNKIALLGKVDLAIDASKQATFARQARLQWVPAKSVKSLSFGYSPATYWLRFDVVNSSPTNRYLVFSHPVLDTVSLRCANADGRVVMADQEGDAFAFSGRAIQLSPIAFRLPDLPAYRCDVSVASTSTILLDAFVVDGVGLAEIATNEYMKMGAMGAAVLAIATFLIASNAFRRSKLLLAYAVASISIAFWTSISSGIGAHLLWPNAVWWQNNGAAITGTLAYAGISAYVWLILSSKPGIPLARRIPQAAMYFWLAISALAFAQAELPIMSRLYGVLGLIHAIVMVLVMSYASIRLRDVGVHILTFGQISFAVPSLLVSALMIGILPPLPWLKSLLPFGFVAELFFLALSLAYESELTRRKVSILQRQQVDDARLAEAKQEAAVEERTGEISNIVGAAIHDVVGPLHNLADTLTNMDAHVDDNVRPHLHSAIELVTRLGIIATNIYAFERFREGSGVDYPPNMIAVDIYDLLRRHVFCARLSMSGRACLVEGEPGTMVTCDANEIGRLIDNMLSNFWRHTHEGATMVIRVAAADHAVTIRFEDNGDGLMALRYSMDDFANGKMMRGKVGGLYNSMRYAKRNGGCLRYEDSPMGGACFVLTLLRYTNEATQ